MTKGNKRYEYKALKAIRGLEAKTISKLEKDGWELLSQDSGTVRTELTFRRTKKPLSKPMVFGAVAVGVAVVAIIAVGIVTENGGKPANTTASTAPPSSAQSTAASPRPSDPISTANSEQFAALLATPDECSSSISDFATEHAGQKIEFDGSVAALMLHGDYKTRYDIAIVPGDDGPNTGIGPFFQFNNVNLFDLHLTGADSIQVGDKLHIVAIVGSHSPRNCIFYIQPESTQMR